MNNKSYQDAVNIFDGSAHYCNFLESMSNPQKKIELDMENSLSVALYYHLFKIQIGSWSYIKKTDRRKRHSISEITQDLIGFYLKAALPPDKYSVVLEASVDNKTYVDIGIKCGDKYSFMIEVKTNIGYQRKAIVPDENKITEFCRRRDSIAEKFEIDKSKVIFILLSEGNVGKKFAEKFWDKEAEKAIELKDRSTEPPYNYIFPLFHASDPCYLEENRKNFENKENKEVRVYGDDEIFKIAESNIVTPLEHIVSLITN